MDGIFIPDITVEMFRNGCLEGIETLMAEGEVYDIEYDPKSAQTDNMCYGCRHERHGNVVCDMCSRMYMDRYEVSNNG